MLALVMIAVPAIAAGTSASLASPDSFASIADTSSRSVAIFVEAGKVLTHPRCLNCHPAGDRPTQTDVSRTHQPPVERGADGFGLAAMRCPSCHQNANYEPGRVPGHADWHLAPREMGWQGRTLAEICVQIKDPARNGGRSLAQIAEHIGTDSLVGWAWAPGADRAPAPGTQQQMGALIEAWIASGAACPRL